MELPQFYVPTLTDFKYLKKVVESQLYIYITSLSSLFCRDWSQQQYYLLESQTPVKYVVLGLWHQGILSFFIGC
jgi:hypothetical protein